MKKGFTIVELMMVIGIIGVLLGVVTTAAASSIKQARARKASACCKMVEQAFATYYAQKGRWPGSIGSRIAGGSFSGGSNAEGVNGQSDSDKYVLNSSEISSMMTDIIQESKNGNPLMDISGLFVSRSSAEPRYESCSHGNSYYPAAGAVGLDFMDAIRGTKRSQKKMKVAEMHFGYPHQTRGGFMPFKVVYSIPTDEMSVSQWHSCK